MIVVTGATGHVGAELVAHSPDATDAAEALPTVTEVAGRPPTTFATWARAHADRFAGSLDA